MDTLVIRHCEPQDAAAVEELRMASWRAGYTGLLPDDYLQRVDGDVERRARDIEHRRIVGVDLVATMDGQMLGWASAGPCRDGDLDPATHAEFYACYIRPGHWRLGIGKQLVERSLAALEHKGRQHITCWILRDNERSRALAASLGFVPDGVEKIFADAGTPVPILRHIRPLSGA